ncbi:MAG TPA: hypothetical protein VG965_02400 [Patescibacteria group bacterium]|nr:hypothetical protein [Patescibacteria group bacterium]
MLKNRVPFSPLAIGLLLIVALFAVLEISLGIFDPKDLRPADENAPSATPSTLEDGAIVLYPVYVFDLNKPNTPSSVMPVSYIDPSSEIDDNAWLDRAIQNGRITQRLEPILVP